MSNKPARNDALADRLSKSREINITVIGRKSGRAVSIPVWFVSDRDKRTPASEWVGYTVVQERAQESVDRH